MIYLLVFFVVYFILGLSFVISTLSPYQPTWYKQFKTTNFWFCVLTWPIGAYLVIKGDL